MIEKFYRRGEGLSREARDLAVLCGALWPYLLAVLAGASLFDPPGCDYLFNPRDAVVIATVVPPIVLLSYLYIKLVFERLEPWINKGWRDQP